MKLTLYTIPRWLFNQKNREIRGDFEIMDCSEFNDKELREGKIDKETVNNAIISVLAVEQETEKAIKVTADCYVRGWSVWLPKSQIKNITIEEV